ncbi:MAG: molecular chaperone Hsp20 [Rhodospirillales bacterium]|jgi:molecular chaperone IbpA|nr:molecular chaperone Hsp20 [Rhodospirillales bacterium]
MRSFDLSPLSRSTIGFDRMMNLFENAARLGEDATQPTYPPYDIEKLDENRYRITMAVAGFAESDLTLTQQASQLLVTGRRANENGADYLHRGLVPRNFALRFDLADFITVTDATLADGLLVIELVRKVPEAMKPRTIAIQTNQALADGGKIEAT